MERIPNERRRPPSERSPARRPTNRTSSGNRPSDKEGDERRRSRAEARVRQKAAQKRKRFLIIGATAFLLLIIIITVSQCGNGNGNETNEATNGAGEVTIAEQVLFDEQDIRLTALSLNTDALLGQELNVLIENNSDQPVIVQVRGASINGLMIDAPVFSPETNSGASNNDSITFLSSELELNDIETIGTIELSFAIINPETFETLFETNLITIETSMASQVEQAVPGEEQQAQDRRQVFSQDGFTIYFIEFEADDIWGLNARFYMNNDSDIPVTVQSQDVSLNGFMISGIMSADMQPGRSTNTTLTFLAEDLETSGIETVSTMDIRFNIVNAETWETILSSDLITITN